ncbi:MAG TPA: aldehyde dehydrogenase family protein, partial [Gammaproteobacteria bacterium]|nr:aldehyde dehydrogenase family protein [Gammaproteobacteria bacterium]
MLEIRNYIDGKLAAAASGGWLDTHEPATGTVYARLPDSDARDVDAAVAAAAKAFPAWSRLSGEERGRWLLKLAELVERDLEKLARAESVDNGKPVDLARRLDIPRAISNLRFFAAAASQFASES